MKQAIVNGKQQDINADEHQILQIASNNIIKNANGGNDCKTYAYLHRTKVRCQVCLGLMHEFFECPTKRKLDYWAKNNNDKDAWGNWKFTTYYHKYDEVEKENIRALARKFAPCSHRHNGNF